MGSEIGGSIIWSIFWHKRCYRTIMNLGNVPRKRALMGKILKKGTAALSWQIPSPFPVIPSSPLTAIGFMLRLKHTWARNMSLIPGQQFAIALTSWGSGSASTLLLCRASTPPTPHLRHHSAIRYQMPSSSPLKHHLVSYLGGQPKSLGRRPKSQKQARNQMRFQIGNA